MKTIKHFHWGLPGPVRLFGTGFYLAVGAVFGFHTGVNLHALMSDFIAWLF